MQAPIPRKTHETAAGLARYIADTGRLHLHRRNNTSTKGEPQYTWYFTYKESRNDKCGTQQCLDAREYQTA